MGTNKKDYKVGDVITFDDTNKLKQIYFDRASKEAGEIDKKKLPFKEAYDNYDYAKYERLKRKYKKEIKFKIVELPE